MEAIEIHAAELVRKIRDKQTAELQGKSPAERIAYYRERARRLHAKLAKRMKKRKAVHVVSA
jgi:hypothetical protein